MTKYSSYISTYIDRDVKELSGTIDSLKFMKFITCTAALCGEMVNYKTIADAADIDQAKTKNWLNILETLGIIFYLQICCLKAHSVQGWDEKQFRLDKINTV